MYVHISIYIHTMGYYSVLEKEETLSLDTTWLVELRTLW